MEFVRAVVVGSGSSSSTPSLSCTMSGHPCVTCADAIQNPTTSRNHRLNPSLLIQLRHPADGTVHNVLIDCGKTFREAALKVFSRYGVSDLSALLLTHEHADACFGLDDLREFSRRDNSSRGLDVYADRATLLSSYSVFRYLFPKVLESAEGSEEERIASLTSARGAGSGWNFRATGATWTATLQWHLLKPMALTHLHICERLSSSSTRKEEGAQEAAWPFVAVPVLHGRDYYCEAYLFRMDSPTTSNNAEPRLFFYCSDVSCVDDAMMERLAKAKQLLLLPDVDAASQDSLAWAAAVPLEVLVLDLLSWISTYSTHLCGEESILAAQRLDAKYTYFVGMSHTVNYEDMAVELATRGLDKRMSSAYDGCLVASAP